MGDPIACGPLNKGFDVLAEALVLNAAGDAAGEKRVDAECDRDACIKESSHRLPSDRDWRGARLKSHRLTVTPECNAHLDLHLRIDESVNVSLIVE